jgi:hypothetical protein
VPGNLGGGSVNILMSCTFWYVVVEDGHDKHGHHSHKYERKNRRAIEKWHESWRNGTKFGIWNLRECSLYILLIQGLNSYNYKNFILWAIEHLIYTRICTTRTYYTITRLGAYLSTWFSHLVNPEINNWLAITSKWKGLVWSAVRSQWPTYMWAAHWLV